MPPTKRSKRRDSSSGSDSPATASSSPEPSADSSDFSSSSSSDSECAHQRPHSPGFQADDDDDGATASYDGARLAFARKVRRQHELLERQSPAYTSALDLSAAVDVVASQISRRCVAHDHAPSLAAPPHARALFPHQARALQWFRTLFAQDLNGILADEMGLGKTMSAAAVLADLFHEAAQSNVQCLPAIIIAPLSTLDTWKSELAQSAAAALRVVVYNGDATARARVLGGNKFDIIITNPDVLVREPHVLSQHTAWSCMVVDEAHRLKNADSFLHVLLSAGFACKRKMLLTGTPVHNNLKELGALLHFCNPSLFPIASSFQSLMGGGLDLATAKAVCAPFLLRRTKADINLMLPPKRRVTIMLPLQPLQQHLYAGILRRCAPALTDSSASFLRNVLVSLRKACSHPYLFNGIEPEPFEEGEHLWFASNKLAALACILPKLKAAGHRVLVFSGMTRVLDIVQDYLTMQNYSFERLDGSIRGSERFDALNRFSTPSAESGPAAAAFVFLLSVRAGGQGLNLTQADTCIFLDSDFNPQVDLQAEDRVHRIGQQKPVLVLRFLSQKTVEEGILLSARKKAAVAEQVLAPQGVAAALTSDGDDVAPRALLDAILVGAQAAIDGGSGAAASVAEAAEQGRDSFDKYFASCDWSRVLSRLDSKEEGEELVAGGGGSAYELEYQPLELDGQRLDVSRLQGQPVPAAARKRHTAADSPARSSKKGLSSDATSAAAASKAESAQTRRAARWAAAGYSSLRLPPLAEEDEEDAPRDADAALAEAAGGGAQGCMSFVVGDVARPACFAGARHYILHCVDSGGTWPSRGVFSALNSAHGTQIQEAYEFAAKMKDLHMGDAHCVRLSSRAAAAAASGVHSVVLLVCLERLPDGTRRIELASFRLGLMALRLHCCSLDIGATCHFHTPMPPAPCPWYAAERELRSQLLQQLPSSAISVYYFRRAAGATSAAAPAAAVKESQTSRLARAFFSEATHAAAVQKQNVTVSRHQKEIPVSSSPHPLPRAASTAQPPRRSPTAPSAPVASPNKAQAAVDAPCPPPPPSALPLFHGLKFGLHQLAWGTASLQEDVVSVITRHGGSVAPSANQPGVTHIICRTATYSDDIATLAERRHGAAGGGAGVPVVRPSWLYESIAKGQLVSPSLPQHAVTPKQIFANLHVCLHEVAPVMELDDMRRAFMLRGAVVTALVHGDTDVIVSSLSVWDSFVSDAHAAYPKVSPSAALANCSLPLTLVAQVAAVSSMWFVQCMAQAQLLPQAPFKIPPQQRVIASTSFYGPK